MTQYPELFAALAAPFDPSEVKNRSQAGRQMSYITSRTAMNRFDAAVGPENWRNHTRVEHLADGTDLVVCTIELRIGNEWIGKEDAGGFREMTEKNRSGEVVEDEENTVKTGYSDAFKRTAILWGVGRYLYRDGVPNYGTEQAPPPSHYEAPQQRTNDWRERAGVQQSQPPQEQRQTSGGQRQHNGPPRSGKALFAWTKEQEQKYDVGLLKYLNEWAKLQGFPGRMVDWASDQVAVAYAEAEKKLASVSGSDHEFVPDCDDSDDRPF